MKNFQEKNRLKNIMQSWPVLIFLSILLLFFIFGVFRFLIKMRDTSKQRDIAEMKVVELKQTKEKLSSDIENLKTDKGIEENIREKFGLVKEGEGLIIIVDDKEKQDLDDGNKSNWFISLFNRLFR